MELLSASSVKNTDCCSEHDVVGPEAAVFGVTPWVTVIFLSILLLSFLH